MAIQFGGDAGIKESLFSKMLRGIAGQSRSINDEIRRMSGNAADKNYYSGAERESVYIEDGFQNVPGTAFSGSGKLGVIDDIKTRRITTQSPQATVYVKKRLFWSLRGEHESMFQDSGEKLFIRASKLLFERKCTQIAAYESLTKLGRIVDETTDLDLERLDSLIALVQSSRDGVEKARNQAVKDANDRLASLDPDDSNYDADVLGALEFAINEDRSGKDSVNDLGIILDDLMSLGKKARMQKEAINTTWVVDTRSNVDRHFTGRGTGVIELTLVDTINTNLPIDGSTGSFNLFIQDPYNLLSISSDDIDIAVRSALLEVEDESNQSSTLLRSEGPQEILEQARELDEELRRARNERFGITGSNNSPLSGADNSEIVFKINPLGDASSQRVTGSISSLSEPFSRDTYNLVFLQLPIEQQLSSTEQSLVQRIFDTLHRYVDKVDAISKARFINKDKNKDFEYAIEQMRSNYVGKSIIQPMDGVHVYIKGNTTRDGDVIGPLSAVLNNSKFIQSFAGGFDALGSNDIMLKEEMRQFGISEKVPVELYRSLRTSSFLRNAGSHVFGGLVTAAKSSYGSNGSYSLLVSGESNLKWLDLSRVNTAPSAHQAQGVLEDPLTPFDIEIDEATGLIKEQVLSSENRSRIDEGLMFYRDGIRQGEQVSEENLAQDKISYNGEAKSVYKHTPGLVYKWKKGVVVATRNVNQRTPLSGSQTSNKLKKEVGLTVIKDNPFANLDVVDVVSLLVTGQPHNYESFVINSGSVGTYAVGLGNSNETFFNSFLDIARSTNRALGSFEAVKTIDISRENMMRRLRLQTELKSQSEGLREKQSEIADIKDNLNRLKSGNNEELRSRTLIELSKKQSALDEALNTFNASIKDAESEGLRIYGDDIIIDSDGNDSEKTEDAIKDEKVRGRFIKMRPQINTKLNQDSNLFIVSDDYDKDLDLQAFAINLSSGDIPIWDSEYKNPLDICKNAANVMDMEFYCDSQGHIRLQAPKYNKVPLSLLAKMLLLNDRGNAGVNIMPPFISNLFQSRRTTLESTVETIDLEITILSRLLFGTDNPPIDVNNQGDASQLINTSVAGESDDDKRGNVEAIINARRLLSQKAGPSPVGNSDNDKKSIEKEIDELNNPNSTNMYTKRLQKTNEILRLSSKKQKVKDTIDKITNRQEKLNVTLKDIKVETGTSLNPTQLSSILEPFGDLVEDDYNDFLGPGSSDRYIIRDDQIIDYDFTESDANVYCRADVTGQQDIIGSPPGVVGGVPVLWAGATDFDLWKRYGYRATTNHKPLFKDAETQCAPYALMLLTRMRRDTVRGTITLVGNEYYQLGDVVYINSRDMLYYVTGVAHNFSYNGGKFTTTLDLRYGHPLGEFIPTPLDVIGKNLIKNQRKFNTTFVERVTTVPQAGRSICVVKFAGEKTEINDIEKTMLTGDLGKSNLAEMKNALLLAQKRLSFNPGDVIEVRGYLPPGKTDEEIDMVRNRMRVVREWLLSPYSGFTDDGDKILLNRDPFSPIEKSRVREFDEDLDPIVLETEGDTKKLKIGNRNRVPSEEVYSMVIDSKSQIHNMIEIVLVIESPDEE